jgi:hypothetical protein
MKTGKKKVQYIQDARSYSNFMTQSDYEWYSVVFLFNKQHDFYCHVYEWIWTGFGLVNEFTEYLQVVTTTKYNNITGLHTLTAAYIVFYVFTSRFLVHNELHYVYYSPSIIRMIKSKIMRWTGNVARMGRGGMHIGFWLGTRKERDH